MQYLGLVGLTLILVRGSLFARVRSVLPSLLTCAMCLGFWVGLVGAVAVDRAALSYANAVSWVLCSATVSFGATLADFSIAFLDAKTGGAP